MRQLGTTTKSPPSFARTPCLIVHHECATPVLQVWSAAAGSWGGICSWGWDDADAGVACRQLAFGGGGRVHPKLRFPLADGLYRWRAVHWTNVRCGEAGNAGAGGDVATTVLSECQPQQANADTCLYTDLATAQCFRAGQAAPPRAAPPPPAVPVTDAAAGCAVCLTLDFAASRLLAPNTPFFTGQDCDRAAAAVSRHYAAARVTAAAAARLPPLSAPFTCDGVVGADAISVCARVPSTDGGGGAKLDAFAAAGADGGGGGGGSAAVDKAAMAVRDIWLAGLYAELAVELPLRTAGGGDGLYECETGEALFSLHKGGTEQCVTVIKRVLPSVVHVLPRWCPKAGSFFREPVVAWP